MIRICSYFFAILLMLTGCKTVLSMSPFYSERSLVSCSDLIGRWVQTSIEDHRNKKSSITIQKADGLACRFTISNNMDDHTFHLLAHAFETGKQTFLDIESDPEIAGKVLEEWPFLIQTHYLVRLDNIGEGKISFHALSDVWLTSYRGNKHIRLANAGFNKDVVLLTGSSSQLQSFLQKYGSDEELFSVISDPLQRVK